MVTAGYCAAAWRTKTNVLSRSPLESASISATASSQMQRLSHSLINAYCWLRVFASPFLLGTVLGAVLFFLIRGTVGVALGGAAAVTGLIFGIRLARHAQRQGQLVEYAHGLLPIKRSAEVTDADSDERVVAPSHNQAGIRRRLAPPAE